MDQRQRRLLAGFLAVVGAVLWTQFLFLPQFRTAGRLGHELKTLRVQMTRAQRDLGQMGLLEKKRTPLTNPYSIPAPTLPPEEQLPDLLEKITQAARASHVRVTALRPKQDFAQMQMGPSGYLEIPLELLATAGYHQVGHFLDALERSESLVRLRELEIRPNNNNDLSNHQVKMVLLAFLLPVSSGEKH